MSNDPNRKFYRTIIQVEVLSENRFDFDDLASLAAAMDTGDLVGQAETQSQVEIDRPQVVNALYRLGSEPGFFMLDENGNDTDDFGDYGGGDAVKEVFQCGSCGSYHLVGFEGDCRDDFSRFASPEEASERLKCEVVESIDLGEDEKE